MTTQHLKRSAAIIAVSLLGICGASAKPLEILTSFYPMYVSTLNVVGDTPGVKVACLTEPFVGCLHDYSLTAGDMKKLSRADVFVANGAGMESFIDKAVKQSPSLKVVEASKGMKLAFEAILTSGWGSLGRSGRWKISHPAWPKPIPITPKHTGKMPPTTWRSWMRSGGRCTPRSTD